MTNGALSVGDYLVGVAILAAIVAPLVYAAITARRLLLPTWTGAPARLAEAIAAIILLLWVSELAGTIGLFAEIPLIIISLLIGGGAWALRERLEGGRGAMRPPNVLRPAEGGTSEEVASGTVPTIAFALAAVASALVTATWAIPLAASYAGGIDGVDSMWYHLPQSAVFVQTGSVTDLHFTDPYFTNWYYPANSELLHAVPMLAFDRDWFSPLLNHLFLALGLLAAWCIGRPWGLGPATLIAAAVVFGAEMTIDFQPGEARNDAVGLAFFLAAIAFLVKGRRGLSPLSPLPVLILAGLAAGLAVGTKLSVLAPVAALVVGVAVLAGRGRRLRDGAVFLAAVIAGGGFWYLRNLIHSGNPLPWIDELGPISLPAPEVALELRPPHSVAHYLFDTDVWSDFFVPGLSDSIGPLWPIIIILTVGAGLVALVLRLWPGREDRARGEEESTGKATRAGGAMEGPAVAASSRGPREAPSRQDPRGDRNRPSPSLLAALGAVTLLTLLAYVFTPLTASGPEGNPEGFAWNLRYIAPALALGLVLVPLLPPPRGRRASLGVALALFAILAFQTARLQVWDFGHEAWAIASAVLVLAGFTAGRLLAARPLPQPVLAAGAATLAALAITAGYVEQERYGERRYADVLDGLHLDRAIAWANPVSDARIATAGRGGVFFQYGLYGHDLSNEVQWLGEPGPRGAWLPIETCEAFREALNAGGYDYLVTTYDRRFPEADQTSREGEWVRRDQAVEAISSDGPVTVFEVGGELDPAGCGPAELEAEGRPTGVAER
jgi:hypothetical protein